VAKNGSVLFEGAYGLADRERRVVNRVETRFRNGSMNKMFTAVAVLTLVQAGKVELDAPIRAYLPDFPNASLASSVTVRQLLTHTGGTGDIFGPEYAANRPILRTHQDYVRLFGSRDPQFAPGSRWQYSNFGYIVLGRLIEQVSGQSYYDYVREHVYTPAGMTSTGSEPEDVRVPDRGIGYTRRPGQADVAPNSDFLPYRGTAAGGGYSTVGDLLRFANALTSHRLVTERFTALLLTGTVEGLGGTYGMGFVERTIGGMRSVGHGGNAPGMDGYLDIFPASGYVVVVLANLDPPAARRVHEFIVHRLPAQ
jgi:CubicO group peptidase (beta-lactamase class C family)